MSTTDASLQSFLQSELLVMANESRKKLPEIKTAVDEALSFLKGSKEKSLHLSREFTDSHDANLMVMKPILMASKSANGRLIAISINILHKLLTHNALHISFISSAFDIIDQVIDATGINNSGKSPYYNISQAGDLQLKVLQCMMPLYTNFGDLQTTELFRGYQCCFRLHESKVLMVTNAVVAIIRQLVIFLFDSAQSVDATKATEDEELLPEQVSRAYSMLQDICLLSNDEAAIVLTSVTRIDKSFALELLESIIANHTRVFVQYSPFVVLLRDKFCTMAVRILTERSNFALCCRLWRVVGLILKNLSTFLPQETEIFVSFAVRILDDQEGSVVWERALVLEVLTYQLLCDADVCHRIYTLCDAKDEGVKVFQDVIAALCRLISSFIKADLTGTAEIKIPFLDQFDKTSAPLVPDGYILTMAFKSLNAFLLNFDDRLMELFAISYANILRAMINLHSKRSFEERLLPCLEKFITLVVFKEEAVRTTIEAVAELALKPAPIKSPIVKAKRQSKSPVNELPPCPFALGTTLCLLEGSLKIVEYLGDAWKTIIWVIRSMHQLASQASQYQIDEKLLTTILTCSDKILQIQLSDKAFEAFTIALTSLPEEDSEAVYWSLGKLNTVYALNMHRFLSSTTPAGWNTLNAKLLLCLRTSVLHLATKDVLLGTLHLYIEEFKKHQDRPDEAQQRPFDLLAELDDNNSIILEGVQICLQGIGDRIPSSWPLVMQLLQSCVESPTLSWPDLQRAFTITKLITSDFLSHLNDNVGLELTKLVTTFCHLRMDEEEMLNISLTSIAMLWDICDTLKSSALLMDILEKLGRVGRDPKRFELRNSAIPTAFRILDSRIDQLDDEQMRLVQELLVELVDYSFKLYESVEHEEVKNPSIENLHHTINSRTKQCDETLELVAEGLTSLWTVHFKRFYSCTDIEDRWKDHLLVLQRYMRGDSESLVSTGILSLCKLLDIPNKNPWLWDAVWNTWLQICDEPEKPFTQTALLKHIGMFSELHSRCSNIDQDWVDSTLTTMNRVLIFNTIDGPTRDRNSPSELQRTCLDSCNQLAKEFRETIIKQYSQWMCLCLNQSSSSLQRQQQQPSPSTQTDPIDSIVRRSMSTTFSGIDIDGESRSSETTFIAMALRIFQEIETLLTDCIDEDIIGIVVDDLARFVRTKYHTPRQGTFGLQLWVPALNLLKIISKRTDRLAWSKIISASVDFIRITRIQDPPPHPTMITQKEVDEDEIFECDFIENHLVETDLIKESKIVDALVFSSKYVIPAEGSKEYFEDDLEEHNMDILSSFFQRDSHSATKIRFVESCLKQILESPDIPLEIKLERVKAPMQQFLDEKPYWGPIPLPKHRQLELECLLSCLHEDSRNLVRPLYSVILDIIAACMDKDRYGIMQYQMQGYKTFEDNLTEKAHLLIASLKI